MYVVVTFKFSDNGRAFHAVRFINEEVEYTVAYFVNRHAAIAESERLNKALDY